VVSYSGVSYTKTDGAPPLKDAVVALSRLCRWNGATERWWPILAHSHVVADLLKPLGVRMELAGLSHDLVEGLGLSDIASPLKNAEIKETENFIRQRIVVGSYLGGIDLSYEWYSPDLKQADEQAASAERFLFLDGKSMCTDIKAVVTTASYVAARKYAEIEYLDPNGRPVKQFLKRFEDLVYDLHALSRGASGSVLAAASGSSVESGSGYASGCAFGSSSATRSKLDRVARQHADDRLMWCAMCGETYGGYHACDPDRYRGA
jgi:hypothetical protein